MMNENRSNVSPSLLMREEALASMSDFCLDLMAEVFIRWAESVHA